MSSERRQHKEAAGRRKWLRNPAQVFLGPAPRSDLDAPVAHKHDEFERASEEDLAGFEIEEDAEGHHYAVRKGHPWSSKNAAPPAFKYQDYSKRPPLHTED